MYSNEIIENLEKNLNQIRQNLIQATSGKSICSIHKYSSPAEYLKYNEGIEYIVRRVLNIAKSTGTDDEITTFLSECEKKFKAFKASPVTASSTWQSYADGGFEGIALVRITLNIS
jgi:hypothetical protein